MSNVNREYAMAVFSVGLENGSLDDISRDLDFLTEPLRENRGYIAFLLSPDIPKEERIEALREAFKDKVCPDTLNFMTLLVENKRADSFSGIIEEYNKLYRESKRVSLARVKSAVALTEEQKERLKARLTEQVGHEVILECLVDETLLGGISVEFDDSKIDGSLKTRLQNIKDVMDK